MQCEMRSLRRWTRVEAYLTTWGAITLQGPHHVAKQSRTMRVSLSFKAASKSVLLQFASRQLRPPSMTSRTSRERRQAETYVVRLWTPFLSLIFAVFEKKRGVKSGR